jgi:hypothetical protein
MMDTKLMVTRLIGACVAVGVGAEAPCPQEEEGVGLQGRTRRRRRSVQAHPRLVPRSVVWIMCAALLLLTTRGSAADPLDQWQWRNPLPNGGILWSTVYANGRFVAVGDDGARAVSADGTDWTYGNCGAVSGLDYYNLACIAYGNGKFVAVGVGSVTSGEGAGVILDSTNGTVWQEQTLPTLAGSPVTGLFGIAYGSGLFVAVGKVMDPVSQATSGAVLTSTDGTHWTVSSSGTADRFGSVAYGDGAFVATTVAPTMILASADGVHWTPSNAQALIGVWSVGYGGGTFVAVGNGGIKTSGDRGLTWTNRLSAPSGLVNVAYGSGTFVVVGSGGVIMTSTNGAAWTPQSSGNLNFLAGVAYGGGRFVATGIGAMLISTNGSDWTNLDSGITANLRAVVQGGGRFVAVGDGGAILSSADGVEWSASRAGDANTGWEGVAYGQGTYVTVSPTRLNPIFRSTDATNWVRSEVQVTSPLHEAFYGAGLFVVCGDNGTILTSTNGLDWTQQSSGTGESLVAAAYGNGLFVVAGGQGTILTSTDGGEWTAQASGVTNGLHGLGFGDGRFVAVGDGGAICTSTDAVNWVRSDSGVTALLDGVGFGGGRFVAVGSYPGTVLSSSNGVDWVGRNPGTDFPLYGPAYGARTFVVVGFGGVVLQSGQMPVPTLHLGVGVGPPWGPISLTLTGTIGDEWTVETSTNLLDWRPIASLTLTNSTTRFTDWAGTNFPHRFYRGLAP